MKKGTGYYLKSYLKNNVAVLFFELIIIVLLALICTMLLGGQPVWLAPVLAVCAYLLAELRFMMAYVASNARKEAEVSENDDEKSAQTQEMVDGTEVLSEIEEPETEEPEIEESVIEEPEIEESVIEESEIEESVIEELEIEEQPIIEKLIVEEEIMESDMAEPEIDQDDDFDDESDFDDDFDLPVRSVLDLGDE